MLCVACVFTGTAQSTLLQPVVWLTIALATAICIVPVLAFRFLKLNLTPQLSDTVRKRTQISLSPALQHVSLSFLTALCWS